MGGRGSSSAGGSGGGSGGGISSLSSAAGGKEWEGKRVYFNDGVKLMRAAGYKVETYGTGAIKSATTPSGDKISNNQAYKLGNSLNKAYYDVKAKKFSVNNSVTQILSSKFKV